VIGIVDYGMGNRRSVEKAARARRRRAALEQRSPGWLRSGRRFSSCPAWARFPEGDAPPCAPAAWTSSLRERAGAGVAPSSVSVLACKLLPRTARSEHEGAEGLGLIPGRSRRPGPPAD